MDILGEMLDQEKFQVLKRDIHILIYCLASRIYMITENGDFVDLVQTDDWGTTLVNLQTHAFDFGFRDRQVFAAVVQYQLFFS